MRALPIRLVLTMLVLLSVFATAPVAFAETVDCTGTLGAETLDNVHVPDGATCTLYGTIVQGNITVGTGATLTANLVNVTGNIQATGSRSVVVNSGSFVNGNIQIDTSVGARIRGVTIGADLQLNQNTGRVLASRNTVGGNLTANQNTGGLTLSFNVVESVLSCQANVPAPTGRGNRAGSKEEQCANL